MQSNEKEMVDELEPVEEIEETKDEFENDTTDWKALALKNQGIAKRYQTKIQKRLEAEKLATKEAEKAKAEEAKAKEKQPQDKKDFDYAEKSYLLSNGIKKEEIPFVWEEYQKLTDKDKNLDKLLDSKYFMNELNEKRELKETEEAVPRGTKRTAGSARDSVEYWNTRGELPPWNQPELRRKVLNARIKKEESASKFTDTPVV